MSAPIADFGLRIVGFNRTLRWFSHPLALLRKTRPATDCMERDVAGLEWASRMLRDTFRMQFGCLRPANKTEIMPVVKELLPVFASFRRPEMSH